MAAGARAAWRAEAGAAEVPEAASRGCKLAQTESAEVKKGILQLVEGDVMKGQVGLLALGKT